MVKTPATFLGLLTLIVLGVMLANAIANPQGTKVIIDGLSGFWKTSINGLLGRASSDSVKAA